MIENAREIPVPRERTQLTNQPIPRVGEIVCPIFKFPRRGRHRTIVHQNHSGLVTFFSRDFVCSGAGGGGGNVEVFGTVTAALQFGHGALRRFGSLSRRIALFHSEKFSDRRIDRK
jgi:hypothetical protein